MTIDPPEFDSELEGHACYVVDSTCHASKTEYDEDGQYQTTECGERIPESPSLEGGIELGSRSQYVDDGEVNMCPECWPNEIVDSPA